MSMVFQSYALYPNMTVARNIEFPLRMHKVDKARAPSGCAAWRSCCRSSTCSSASRASSRAASASAWRSGARWRASRSLYLFDEPLSNLDAQLRLDMRTEIKKLHQRLGATIVYVTHDQIEAMTLATRIAVMKGGVVQQFGTPYEVYNRPANTFVAGFMGSPRMNLMQARLAGSNGALALTIGGDAHAGQRIELPPDRWCLERLRRS